jgi:hypothetical protein
METIKRSHNPSIKGIRIPHKGEMMTVQGDPHDPEAIEEIAETIEENTLESEVGPASIETVENAAQDAKPEVQSNVQADTVEIRQGGAEHVEADKIFVEQGGIGRAEGRFIDVKDGGIGVVQAQNVTLTDGGAGVIAAENVKMQDAMAFFVAANSIEGEDTTVIFDLRAAVVFGVILGTIISLFRLLIGRRES